MYFTSGQDRAFERLMQEKPGFDHYDGGGANAPEDCGSCRFYRPDWKYQYCVYSELKEQQLNLDISIFLEVLENLIDNAMRFSVQCVRVEFRYSQSLLNVCVHDDGKGFQPDELSKAVKPYYHGESVGTEHYGMGLYICKMLCEKHGGFLRVYNSPGGGACVEFNIAA